MERELERLLTGTTPPTPLPDIEALHRRGARRRMAVRLSAASAVVVVVAMGALAVQGVLAPDTIEFGPAAPSGGDGGAPDTPDRDGEGEGGEGAASKGDDMEDDNEAPFDLSPEEMATIADLLPDEGTEANSDDIEAVLGTNLGEDPYLRTEFVDCYYQGGEGEIADAPEDARDRSERFGEEMTTADLIGECLDTDFLRSGEGHAPGPFTVCEGARRPEDREHSISEHTDNGWAVAAPDGADEGLGQVPFPAVVPWKADCADAEVEGNTPVVLDDLASLDAFNDNRRVEVATKALERDCPTYGEAYALGMAAADRLEGDWRVLFLDAVTPRFRPCAGLEFDGEWGTITVGDGAYWDRDVAVPEPLEVDDPRFDQSLVEALNDALEERDPGRVANAVERQRVRGVEEGPSLDDVEDWLGTEGTEGAGDLDDELIETVLAAFDGHCMEGLAPTLALGLQRVLSAQVPDTEWFVGEVDPEDLSPTGVETPGPQCELLELTSTATFDLDREPRPAIVIHPVWFD